MRAARVAALDGERALAGRGQHLERVEDLGGLVEPAQPGRPARARTTASSSPSATEPQPGVDVAADRSTTSRPRPSARSCAARRGEPVPTRAPAGSSPRVRPSRATSTSRGSSRGGTAASDEPAAGAVGRSLSECTARSTSPASRASRSAVTNTPDAAERTPAAPTRCRRRVTMLDELDADGVAGVGRGLSSAVGHQLGLGARRARCAGCRAAARARRSCRTSRRARLGVDGERPSARAATSARRGRRARAARRRRRRRRARRRAPSPARSARAAACRRRGGRSARPRRARRRRGRAAGRRAGRARPRRPRRAVARSATTVGRDGLGPPGASGSAATSCGDDRARAGVDVGLAGSGGPGPPASSRPRASRSTHRDPREVGGGRGRRRGAGRGRRTTCGRRPPRGRLPRRDERRRSTTCPTAPVQETTRSAAASAAGRSASGTDARRRPARARRSGRAHGVRLATVTPAHAGALQRGGGQRRSSTRRRRRAPGRRRAGRRSPAARVEAGRRPASARPGRCRSRCAPACRPAGRCWNRALSTRPAVPASCAGAQRRAHLAEDLALADDHRVQAAGDREQVRDGAVLVVHVEVRGELVDAARRVLRRAASQTSSTPPWNVSTSA